MGPLRMRSSRGMEGFLDLLSRDEAEDLRSIGRTRSYGALFHQGDDPGAVIVLIGGRVKVAPTPRPPCSTSTPSDAARNRSRPGRRADVAD
jgi:hypothetical protein